jgi:hypothetical protein
MSLRLGDLVKYCAMRMRALKREGWILRASALSIAAEFEQFKQVKEYTDKQEFAARVLRKRLREARERLAKQKQEKQRKTLRLQKERYRHQVETLMEKNTTQTGVTLMRKSFDDM